MVMRASNQARRIPTGTVVRFTTDLPDSDVQRGDIGWFRISQQTLPRGRGTITTYYVDFDDNTSIEVSPSLQLQITQEAPEARESRSEARRRVLKGLAVAGRKLLQTGKEAYKATEPRPSAEREQPSRPQTPRRVEPKIEPEPPPKPQQTDDEFWWG